MAETTKVQLTDRNHLEGELYKAIAESPIRTKPRKKDMLDRTLSHLGRSKKRNQLNFG